MLAHRKGADNHTLEVHMAGTCCHRIGGARPHMTILVRAAYRRLAKESQLFKHASGPSFERMAAHMVIRQRAPGMLVHRQNRALTSLKSHQKVSSYSTYAFRAGIDVYL